MEITDCLHSMYAIRKVSCCKIPRDKFESGKNCSKDELWNFLCVFLKTVQKEASIEQDSTLVVDSAIRPPPLAWNLVIRDRSVFAVLLPFLAGSDLLHLFDGKSDRLWGQTKRQWPLRIRHLAWRNFESTAFLAMKWTHHWIQAHVATLPTCLSRTANFRCSNN